jgi:O-methyltransferase domain
LGLHERSARDFFRVLVALGFLQRDDGVYSNTTWTDTFLNKRRTSYIGGLLETANHRLFGFWNGLTEALRTGKPQNEVKGGHEPFFAVLYADPERLKGFLRAMIGLSHGGNLVMAARFPWSEYRSVVDVGTAQGDLDAQVAIAHSHLTGIGFDLSTVGPIFEEYAAERGVSKRVQFVAGDFFTGRIPAGDVVMMGHILHDSDLAQKQQLIRMAWDALPSGGALIVYDDRSKNAFGLLMNRNMLIETPGGFDYTGADCVRLMNQIGFTDAYLEQLAGPDSMVVGIK